MTPRSSHAPALPATSRGAYLVAALVAATVAGCVDLKRPPELARAMESEAGVSGRAPDAGADAASPRTTDVDAPYAPPEPDAPIAVDAPPDLPVSPADALDGPSPPDVPARQDGVSVLPPRPADAAPDTRPPVDAPPPDAPVARPPDAADVAPPMPVPDTGPPAGALVIDDFGDGSPERNNLGAEVISENQIASVAAGELAFEWRSGGEPFQSVAQNLAIDGCPLDVSGYRTLHFRMRASVPDKPVYLVMGLANENCTPDGTVDFGVIAVGTAMATYDVDLTAFDRENVRFFQWVASPDSSRYTIDDIWLLP